jgi:hypothetical protein
MMMMNDDDPRQTISMRLPWPIIIIITILFSLERKQKSKRPKELTVAMGDGGFSR